ncbi:MAG: hypothetical protein HYR97_07245 [Candidatus Melainabacteria bacterium]|nr:hypothetical protein [Candidatus Melainabacteria bacterium]MBI3308508.1 hypothetical protein [Candidatus Melainabacteria bacterium]
MNNFIKKLIVLIPLAFCLAALPIQNGLCSCAVEGGVCGDPPSWDPCCNPDKFECEIEEGTDYGTCVPREEEAAE